MDELITNRLYRLSGVYYVQHDGVAPLPAEIETYARNHNGDYPAYIPLPDGPTEFDIGGARGVSWDGQGALPVEIMEYVVEHGTLPRRTADAVLE